MLVAKKKEGKKEKQGEHKQDESLGHGLKKRQDFIENLGIRIPGHSRNAIGDTEYTGDGDREKPPTTLNIEQCCAGEVVMQDIKPAQDKEQQRESEHEFQKIMHRECSLC